MHMSTKNYLKLFLIYQLFSYVLGSAILYGYLAAGIISIGVLYLIERKCILLSYKKYLLITFFGSMILFLRCTFWFTNISASGWGSKIWIFSPSQWLTGVLIVCAVFVCFLSLLPRILLWFIVKKSVDIKVLFPLVWSTCLILVEICISISMAIYTKGNGTPILPHWNFSSIALIIPSKSSLGNIFELFGFWGSSFIIYLVVSTLIELTVLIKNKTNRSYKIYLPVLYISFGILLLSIANYAIKLHSKQNPYKTNVMAISSDQNNNSYLEDIVNVNKSSRKDFVIVLPEYSSLLGPFPNGILDLQNKDFRMQISSSLNKNSLIVGTEDHYVDGTRYVETYVANNKLEVVKSKQKEFLVPGGEYIIPMVNYAINKVDSRAVTSFATERGRHVIKNPRAPQKSDSSAKNIGIGACSTIITPYAYRKQVKEGAQVLASNVSFSQFKNAPEYENYVKRFASINARSLSRPFIVSAYSGSALVIKSNGSVQNQINNGIIKTEVSSTASRTIYSILGDIIIVIGICIMTIIVTVRFVYFKK